MRGVWTRACTSVSAHARLCFTCFNVSVNVPYRSRRLISSVQVWAAAERPIQPSAPSDASHALDHAQRAGGAQYCEHFQRTTHYTQAVQTLHALYTSEASTLPVAPLNVHRTLASDACKIARLVASVFLARVTGCAACGLALAHRPGASTCCVPLIDI